MKKFAVLICMISFFACEEQMVMIPDFKLPSSDRVVLIEELTGVNCPNCPSGSAKLASLIEQFEGKVIGVGIHGGFLTEPVTGSAFDFNNEFSESIETSFQPFIGKPSAVINRVQYDDQPFLAVADPNTWLTYVEREFNKPHTLEVFLSSTYDSATRQLEVTVTTGALSNINESLFISVLLVESHILDAQKNTAEIIPAYEHNHVLRTMLTDWNGDALAESLAADELITRTYNYTLPAEDGTWVAENMEIVAHVRTGSSILQAAEVHLSE